MNFSQTYITTGTGSMHRVNVRAYVEDLVLQSVHDNLQDDLVIQVANGFDYGVWFWLREKLYKMDKL